MIDQTRAEWTAAQARREGVGHCVTHGTQRHYPAHRIGVITVEREP